LQARRESLQTANVADVAAEAGKFNLPERSTNLALAALGDSTGLGPGQQDLHNRRMNAARECIGDDARDGLSVDAGTNEPVQSAIVAMFDELERLRAALRHTIDDMERIRGSVQLNLHALPPNRGAFRVS
jgi:hypothetical protein